MFISDRMFIFGAFPLAINVLATQTQKKANIWSTHVCMFIFESSIATQCANKIDKLVECINQINVHQSISMIDLFDWIALNESHKKNEHFA